MAGEKRAVATTEVGIKQDFYDAREVAPLDAIAEQIVDLRRIIADLEQQIAALRR